MERYNPPRIPWLNRDQSPHLLNGQLDSRWVENEADHCLPQVWLLEMNSNPALHTNCEVLKEVIPGVVMETLGELWAVPHHNFPYTFPQFWVPHPICLQVQTQVWLSSTP